VIEQYGYSLDMGVAAPVRARQTPAMIFPERSEPTILAFPTPDNDADVPKAIVSPVRLKRSQHI
jgi:hypothetical protein